MFGQVLAPPPSTKDTMDAGDLLSCFTETGSPAACELSPIAMVSAVSHGYNSCVGINVGSISVALFPGLRTAFFACSAESVEGPGYFITLRVDRV